jgi:hypothetical protein
MQTLSQDIYEIMEAIPWQQFEGNCSVSYNKSKLKRKELVLL